MSRMSKPYDSARAETIITKLKQEEVYLLEYKHSDHAHSRIKHFVEEVHNHKWLPLAVGFSAPGECVKLSAQSIRG